MLRKLVIFLSLFQVSYVFGAPLKIYTEHAPPFQVLQNEVVSGTSTSIVNAIVAEAGYSADIKVFPWTRAITSALQSPDVMVFSLIRSKERADKMNWIAPVLFYELAFIGNGNRDDLKLSSYEDVKSLSTAIVRGDATLPYLKEYGFSADEHFVLVHSIEEAWRLMLVGKVDLVIDDVKAVKPMLRKFGDPSKKAKPYLALQGLSVPAYLAASKEFDPKVISDLKNAFERLRMKGQYPLEQEYGRWLQGNAQ